MRQRLLVAALAVAVVAMSLLASHPASATTAASANETIPAVPLGFAIDDPEGHADVPLMESLAGVGLLDDWFAAATGAASVAALSVEGSADYAAARGALLAQAQAMTFELAAGADRTDDLDRLSAQIERLHQLSVHTRQLLVVSGAHGLEGFDLAAPTPDAAPVKVAPASTPDRPNDVVDALAAELAGLEADLAVQLGAVVRRFAGGGKVIAAAGEGLFEMRGELERLADRVAAVRVESEEARARFEAMAEDAQELIAAAHVERTLARTPIAGLPVVTLDAYVSGAEAIRDRCSLDWTILAGIGRIESFHGTIGGSAVAANGDVTQDILGPLLDGGATLRAALAAQAAESDLVESVPPSQEESPEPAPTDVMLDEDGDGFDDELWGYSPVLPEREPDSDGFDDAVFGPPPPLDRGDHTPFDVAVPGVAGDEVDAGTEPDVGGAEEDQDEEDDFGPPRGNGFAVIVDTDNGRYDGNSAWDRAVGPMQFIPETWDYWEADGNGDGVSDPQNLFDAAVAAGKYLCYLQRISGPSPFVYLRGYNDSSRYVREVLGVADSLAATSLPLITGY